ncbi:MAG TPA: hypothetical protein VMG14_04660 [Thermoplasmata archaeon]|nr:hypothetical protein [Thermoplasmata archaeon]
MSADSESPPAPRGATATVDEPAPARGWRAGLAESFPLLAAAIVFAVLGAIAASRGLDVGPAHIHLSVLLYALAAVAAVGAIVAGLSASEDEETPPTPVSSEAPAASAADDIGRPRPSVVRGTRVDAAPAPWMEDDEPLPPRRPVARPAPTPPSGEIDRALDEIDAIQTALDRRPPRSRATAPTES